MIGKPISQPHETPAEPDRSRTTVRRWYRVVLPLAAVLLYLPGINWGIPSLVSWSQDSISALRTIGPVRHAAEGWKGRYPPLHYYLLYATYRPALAAWASQDATDHNSKRDLPTLDAPKMGTLMLIARGVSIVMAIAAAMGVFFATLALTGDDLAALAAALALMLGAAFAYFARLGNVDVPAACWISWSVFFYIKCINEPDARHALLLGFFGSLAISTKDAMAGIYPGMALTLLILETARLRQDRPLSTAVRGACLQPRWVLGLVAFALPYLFLNGALTDPQPYLDRMRYWLDASPNSICGQQLRYDDLFDLTAATVRYGAAAVGWPWLMLTAIATVGACWQHRKMAVLTLLPCLSYYVLVIVRIDFVYARFLFPMLVLLAMPTGWMVARLCRGARSTAWWRFGALGAAVVPTILYTCSVSLEMLADSRYAAEAWFDEHVPRERSVGAFLLDEKRPLKPQYLPRVHEMGYPTYPVAMSLESFRRPQPDYLILTSYNYEDFNPEQRKVMTLLGSGKLGYETVAEFHSRFLPTQAPNRGRASLLSLAGWGTPTPGKISPTILVLRRTNQSRGR